MRFVGPECAGLDILPRGVIIRRDMGKVFKEALNKSILDLSEHAK